MDNGPSALEISHFLYDARFSKDDTHMFYVALIINFLLAGTDAYAKKTTPYWNPSAQRPHWHRFMTSPPCFHTTRSANSVSSS